jgi:hypothetical protein
MSQQPKRMSTIRAVLHLRVLFASTFIWVDDWNDLLVSYFPVLQANLDIKQLTLRISNSKIHGASDARGMQLLLLGRNKSTYAQCSLHLLRAFLRWRKNLLLLESSGICNLVQLYINIFWYPCNKGESINRNAFSRDTIKWV